MRDVSSLICVIKYLSCDVYFSGSQHDNSTLFQHLQRLRPFTSVLPLITLLTCVPSVREGGGGELCMQQTISRIFICLHDLLLK